MTPHLSAPALLIAAMLTSTTLAQAASGSSPVAELATRTTIPIVFTRAISSRNAHPGDAVEARTTQPLHLAGGTVLQRGAIIHGHVVASIGFTYNNTPYARQKPAALAIQFDSLQLGAGALPLHVTVRAMASPIATNDALTPGPSDMDPLGTVQRVGGDLMTRWQKEVTNTEGDVVGYQHKDGVYAHLIANGRCDAGDDEVPMGIFSASACGLYGFGGVAAKELGSSTNPSRMTLISTHGSPTIWKGTNLLLEVLPEQAR